MRHFLGTALLLDDLRILGIKKVPVFLQRLHVPITERKQAEAGNVTRLIKPPAVKPDNLSSAVCSEFGPKGGTVRMW